MPIVIKELLVSDQLSEALEKINFNFDQLMLAGGGPPGPIGPQGPQGIPGPDGERGDHLFGGLTAPSVDYTGSILKQNDHWIDQNGDLKFFDGSTWQSSGINLRGPEGPEGAQGGSMEFGLWRGTQNAYRNPTYTNTGNPPINFLPGDKLSSDDVTKINYLIPNGGERNVLFLGNKDWAKFNLNNFIAYKGQVTGVFPESTPKLSIIQNSIGVDGFSGIAIGAYGMTSGTLDYNNSNYTSLSGGWNSSLGQNGGPISDARNMFYAGISIDLLENPDPNVKKIKHGFKARTMSLDFNLQAGDMDPQLLLGNKPSISLSANNNITFKGLDTSNTADSTTDLIRFVVGPTANRFRNPSYLGFSSYVGTTSYIDSYIDPILNSGISNINLLVNKNALILNELHVTNPNESNPSSIYSINLGKNRKHIGSSKIDLYSRNLSQGVPSPLPTLSIFTETVSSLYNSNITHNDTGKFYINSNNYINISQYGDLSTTYATFDSINKRFGLGTDTPTTLAHIKGQTHLMRLEGQSQSYITFDLGANELTRVGLKSDIPFTGDNNNNFDFNISHKSTNGSIILSTNDKNHLWTDWVGNVGIGDKSPKSKLFIYENFEYTTAISRNAILTSAINNLTSAQLNDSSTITIKTQLGNITGTNQPRGIIKTLIGSYLSIYSGKTRATSFIQSDIENVTGFDNSPNTVLSLQAVSNSYLSVGKSNNINENLKVHISSKPSSTSQPKSGITIEGSNSVNYGYVWTPTDIDNGGNISFYPSGYNNIDYSSLPYSNWKAFNFLENVDNIDSYTQNDNNNSDINAKNGLRGSIKFRKQNTLEISSNYWKSNVDDLDKTVIDKSNLRLSATGNIQIIGAYHEKTNDPYDDGNYNIPGRPNKLIPKYAFDYIPGYSEQSVNLIESFVIGQGMVYIPILTSETINPKLGLNSKAPNISIDSEKDFDVSIGGSTLVYGSHIRIQNSSADYTTLSSNQDLNIVSLNSPIENWIRFYNTDGNKANLILDNLGYVRIHPWVSDYVSNNNNTPYSRLGKSPLDIYIPSLARDKGGAINTASTGVYKATKTTWREIGTVADYNHYVILLHPCAKGNGIAAGQNGYSGNQPGMDFNICIGNFYQLRGNKAATTVSNRYEVSTQSSYDNNTGYVNAFKSTDGSNGNVSASENSNWTGWISKDDKLGMVTTSRNECFLTIVPYGDDWWVALYPGYSAQAHIIYFDGVYQNTNGSALADWLKIVPFETINEDNGFTKTNTIINENIRKYLFLNRFYHGTGNMTKKTSGNKDSLQYPTKYAPNYVGNYQKQIKRGVQSIDGLSFNQNSKKLRPITEYSSSTAPGVPNEPIVNASTGHIGSISLAHIKIPRPLYYNKNINTVLNGNTHSTYISQRNSWPIEDYDSSYTEVNKKWSFLSKPKIINQLGIERVVVYRDSNHSYSVANFNGDAQYIVWYLSISIYFSQDTKGYSPFIEIQPIQGFRNGNDSNWFNSGNSGYNSLGSRVYCSKIDYSWDATYGYVNITADIKAQSEYLNNNYLGTWYRDNLTDTLSGNMYEPSFDFFIKATWFKTDD